MLDTSPWMRKRLARENAIVGIERLVESTCRLHAGAFMYTGPGECRPSSGRIPRSELCKVGAPKPTTIDERCVEYGCRPIEEREL